MAAATHTRALRDAMRDAMATRNVTFRGLAERTAQLGVRNGRGLTHAYLSQVAGGKERPSLDAIEAICQALELDPATITEHQLAVARRMFDERPPPFGVGEEQALANLALLVSSDGRTAAAREARRLAEQAAQQRDGTPRRTGKGRGGRDAGRERQ